MSTVKTNNLQLGQSLTATNNFSWYQPSSPDGTVRLGVGNAGATTSDVLVANSSGNVGIGTSSPSSYGKFGVASGATYLGVAPDAYTSAVVGPRAANDGTASFLLSYSAIASYGSNFWKLDSSSTSFGIWQNSNQRLTIDANGNLVVGSVTSDSVGSTTTITIDRVSGNGQLSLAANGTVRGRIFADNSTSEFRIGNPTSNPMMFFTANLERARINANGNLLVGTTTDSGRVTAVPKAGLDPQTSSWATAAAFCGTGSYGGGVSLLDNGTAGYLVWVEDAGKDFNIAGNTVGSATTGGVYINNYATSWSARSDERLKQDLIPIENGLEKVCSLRAVIGAFRSRPEVRYPFLIAQDVQKVLPEAVSVADKSSEEQYLGVSYTDTIPLLVAAIKELSAEIEILKAKVNA